MKHGVHAVPYCRREQHECWADPEKEGLPLPPGPAHAIPPTQRTPSPATLLAVTGGCSAQKQLMGRAGMLTRCIWLQMKGEHGHPRKAKHNSRGQPTSCTPHTTTHYCNQERKPRSVGAAPAAPCCCQLGVCAFRLSSCQLTSAVTTSTPLKARSSDCQHNGELLSSQNPCGQTARPHH